MLEKQKMVFYNEQFKIALVLDSYDKKDIDLGNFTIINASDNNYQTIEITDGTNIINVSGLLISFREKLKLATSFNYNIETVIIDDEKIEVTNGKFLIDELVPLAGVVSEDKVTPGFAEYYTKNFGEKTYAKSKFGLWSCSCGAINHANEQQCYVCDRKKEDLEKSYQMYTNSDSYKIEQQSSLANKNAPSGDKVNKGNADVNFKLEKEIERKEKELLAKNEKVIVKAPSKPVETKPKEEPKKENNLTLFEEIQYAFLCIGEVFHKIGLFFRFLFSLGKTLLYIIIGIVIISLVIELIRG